MNLVPFSEDIETAYPVCGHYGIYRKFHKNELADHLNKEHTKFLVGFLWDEAYNQDYGM